MSKVQARIVAALQRGAVNNFVPAAQVAQHARVSISTLAYHCHQTKLRFRVETQKGRNGGYRLINLKAP